MDKFETWDIEEQSYDKCWWLDFDWCKHRKEPCSYDICPLKVEGSHRLENTYGKTIEKL